MRRRVYSAVLLVADSRLIHISFSPNQSLSMVQTTNDWPCAAIEETEEQRVLAKKTSDEIDEAIQREKRTAEKKRTARRILLLGPSQSGKSTWLKNFQLTFAPKAFHAEAEAWRAVIHLNLTRSVNSILDQVSTAFTINQLSRRKAPDIGQLRIRLSPLRQVEISLNKCLAVERETTPRRPSPVVDGAQKHAEIVSDNTIRSGSAWKALARSQSLNATIKTELQKTRSILDACRDDIVALWSDPVIRRHLVQQGAMPEDSSAFFLDNVSRITEREFVPTADDILRARLETIGVEEHHVIMETADIGQEWIFYDVEGSRGQRATWIPYFDDVHAIIFLVSMADFDQPLPEAPDVNRFTDSLSLWKSICENKLIAHIPIMLFLNKIDLLEEKLNSGTSFGQFVEDFSGQPNDLNSVGKYFKQMFVGTHEQYSPNHKRRLYVHTTCAIRTEAMSLVLREVTEVILLAMLKGIDMI